MKCILESIDVQHERNTPRLFIWRSTLFEVREILDWWVIQTGWWLPNGDIRRVYFRVVVRPLVQIETRTSGVIDIYRSKSTWVLVSILE